MTKELQYIPLDDDNKVNSLSDLGCAGALIEHNFELLSLDRGEPQRVRFLFKYKKGFGDTVNAYNNKKLSVDSQSYFNTLKNLKSRIYNNQ